MELAAIAGLAGLGYIVSKYSGGSQREHFTAAPTPSGALQQPPSNPITKRETGASARGTGSSLDHFFQPYQTTPVAPKPISSNTPLVEMRSDGVEEEPSYVDDYVVSPLSGQKIGSTDFAHNNMVPYYGGRIKQNTNVEMNTSRLDAYTGAGSMQIKKQEVEAMFNTAQTPYGNPFGQEESADFVRSRLNDSRNRGGERPFEPVKVAPGIGEEFGALGKGGFQQLEVNEIMRPRDTNELRTSNNPKLSYNSVVVPGQHYVAKSAEDAGEVRKYKPDRFYIDETGERFFVTNGEVIKEAARPVQILNYTAREETSAEYYGPGQSQDFQESYVPGSYRAPSTKQYSNDMYRNANLTEYYTNNVDGKQADYGRAGFDNRPNERDATSQRVMGLNLKPADTVAVTARYGDDARPTRRAETVGNIRQTGTATGYAGGAPATTVWDPMDVARTTVKEGTVARDWIGIAAPASAPAKLTVYDPDDVARHTQKERLSNISYYGGSFGAEAQDFTSREAYGNAHMNTNKEKVAQRRKPIAGNGGLALYSGEVNQTARRPLTDDMNNRALAPNVMVGLTPGMDDIGQIKYRAPLNLDVSSRNTPDIIESVVNNPLQQSLHKNANLMQNYQSY